MRAQSGLWARSLMNASGGELLRPIGLSLLLAFLNASLTFLMFTLVARAAGPANFGLIAMVFSGASFLAVFALAGQEFLALRSWSEYVQTGRFDLARGVMRFGWRICVIGSAFVAGMGAVLGYALRVDPLLVTCVVAFVIAQMLCLYSSQLARVVSSVLDGSLHRDITWKTLVALAACLGLLSATTFSAELFFGVAAVGCGLATLLQMRAVCRAMPTPVRSAAPLTDPRTWTPRSLRNWLVSVLEASSRFLDVLLIGMFLDPTAAGLYFAASRISSLFAVASDGFNSFSIRRIPELYFAGRHVELRRVLKQLAVLTTCATTGGFAAIVLLGPELLRLFDSSYAAHGEMLLVLAAGSAFSSLIGPVPRIPLLLGHESAYLVRMSAGLLARAACIVAFGALGGPFAAAAGVAASTMGVALVLLITCWLLTGLDPSPLALFRSAPNHTLNPQVFQGHRVPRD